MKSSEMVTSSDDFLNEYENITSLCSLYEKFINIYTDKDKEDYLLI